MSEAMNMTGPEPLDAASGTLELMTRAAREGASDAQAAAERAWSATGRFVSRFVYTTCYTLSYGVVFPSTMISRSIPRDSVAVRGLVDGASAAIRKVDELRGLHIQAM